MANVLPRLIVRDAFGNQREVEIARTPFAMGRQSDSDLVLLDSRISRRHARIIQTDKGYLIEDLRSRHGTAVNGEAITSCLLKSGDRISLGVADSYTLSFAEDQAVLPELLKKLEKAATGPAPQLQHLGLLLRMEQMMHRAPALEEVLVALVDSALQLTSATDSLWRMSPARAFPRPCWRQICKEHSEGWRPVIRTRLSCFDASTTFFASGHQRKCSPPYSMAFSTVREDSSS